MVGALTTLIVRDAPTLQHIDSIIETTAPGQFRGRINGTWKYPNNSRMSRQRHGKARQVLVFYAINLRIRLNDVKFQVIVRLT